MVWAVVVVWNDIQALTVSVSYDITSNQRPIAQGFRGIPEYDRGALESHRILNLN